MRFDANEESYTDNGGKDQRKKCKYCVATLNYLLYRKKTTNMRFE